MELLYKELMASVRKSKDSSLTIDAHNAFIQAANILKDQKGVDKDAIVKVIDQAEIEEKEHD